VAALDFALQQGMLKVLLAGSPSDL
jgi:hypothetical protein